MFCLVKEFAMKWLRFVNKYPREHYEGPHILEAFFLLSLISNYKNKIAFSIGNLESAFFSKNPDLKSQKLF